MGVSIGRQEGAVAPSWLMVISYIEHWNLKHLLILIIDQKLRFCPLPKTGNVILTCLPLSENFLTTPMQFIPKTKDHLSKFSRFNIGVGSGWGGGGGLAFLASCGKAIIEFLRKRYCSFREIISGKVRLSDRHLSDGKRQPHIWQKRRYRGIYLGICENSRHFVCWNKQGTKI